MRPNYCQEFFAENAVLNPKEALYLRLNKKTQAPFSAFLQLSDKYLIFAQALKDS